MTKTKTVSGKGLKLDENKPMVGDVIEGFSSALLEISKVGDFGIRKYKLNNWKKVENGKRRFMNAFFRHLFKHFNGELIDTETGFRHLSHCAWNMLAVLSFELEEHKTIEEKL